MGGEPPSFPNSARDFHFFVPNYDVLKSLRLSGAGRLSGALFARGNREGSPGLALDIVALSVPGSAMLYR